jgi:hypothetical protein
MNEVGSYADCPQSVLNWSLSVCADAVSRQKSDQREIARSSPRLSGTMSGHVRRRGPACPDGVPHSNGQRSQCRKTRHLARHPHTETGDPGETYLTYEDIDAAGHLVVL